MSDTNLIDPNEKVLSDLVKLSNEYFAPEKVQVAYVQKTRTFIVLVIGIPLRVLRQPEQVARIESEFLHLIKPTKLQLRVSNKHLQRRTLRFEFEL